MHKNRYSNKDIESPHIDIIRMGATNFTNRTSFMFGIRRFIVKMAVIMRSISSFMIALYDKESK